LSKKWASYSYKKKCKCLAQGHNKRTCRHQDPWPAYIHTIPILCWMSSRKAV